MDAAKYFIVFLIIGILSTACQFPQDPENTLERVQGGTLRVGVVEDDPWVKRVNDQPAGIEVVLVRQFAESLDAEIEWVWGNEQNHMEALERFELDLVIGGLTQATPWQRRVGLTQPYYNGWVAVGVPPSERPPERFEGLEVAVEEGDAAAAYLEYWEAIPVRVDDLSPEIDGPVAAPAWKLRNWGFNLMEEELYETQHVMAVPPGENGWLVEVEKFLFEHQWDVEEMLAEEVES